MKSHFPFEKGSLKSLHIQWLQKNATYYIHFLHSFSIKNIFYDKMDLRLFYFDATIYQYILFHLTWLYQKLRNVIWKLVNLDLRMINLFCLLIFRGSIIFLAIVFSFTTKAVFKKIFLKEKLRNYFFQVAFLDESADVLID